MPGLLHFTSSKFSLLLVELIESEYPLRVEHYGLVTDTAGPGRFRGGNSLIREFRVLSDDVMLIVRSDKRDFPPHGLFGGGTGAPSWNIINPGPEQKIMPVTTTRPVALQKGDVFRHIMAGGGGFGDPLMREPQHVLDDVRAGRVSIAEARTAYGVVIDDHGALTFDAEATRTARESPRRVKKS